MEKGGEGGERVRIENSSALIAMKQLEKWLSGHKRLSTWQSLDVHKRLRLREILLDSEVLLESVSFPRRRWGGFRSPGKGIVTNVWYPDCERVLMLQLQFSLYSSRQVFY